MKKYNGTAWVDTTLRQYKTATDTITTLPTDVYADGNNATVGLVGNMSQTGTPTPQNPIQPSECGDLETIGTKAGQYKIPISSASTTTPVYLGEVQTTRKIKKLVLTGDEDSWHISGNFFFNDNINPDYLRTSYRTVYCTHYQGINNVTTGSQVGDGECAFYSVVGVQRLYIKDSNYSTVASFTTYLQQQYAAGTPVTVWYVLATPTIGIVNEPLRKIGNYADTVSGISIPTITGKDTFDVLTTLKPSEVSLSYTGWNDASVKEYDGSQWQ